MLSNSFERPGFDVKRFNLDSRIVGTKLFVCERRFVGYCDVAVYMRPMDVDWHLLADNLTLTKCFTVSCDFLCMGMNMQR